MHLWCESHNLALRNPDQIHTTYWHNLIKLEILHLTVCKLVADSHSWMVSCIRHSWIGECRMRSNWIQSLGKIPQWQTWYMGFKYYGYLTKLVYVNLPLKIVKTVKNMIITVPQPNSSWKKWKLDFQLSQSNKQFVTHLILLFKVSLIWNLCACTSKFLYLQRINMRIFRILVHTCTEKI